MPCPVEEGVHDGDHSHRAEEVSLYANLHLDMVILIILSDTWLLRRTRSFHNHRRVACSLDFGLVNEPKTEGNGRQPLPLEIH
jgi:hypothetical protein